MNFFKAVFAEDSETSDVEENERPVSDSPKKSSKDDEEEDEEAEDDAPLKEHESTIPNPSPKASDGSGWSFGGLIKTLSTKSESVIQTYRRDLEEFRSGLKKETEVIREVASRAVKELPVSLEVGASVAQGSLESVGQAIDEFGSSVWRGTTDIISQGKDALLAADQESDSSDSQRLSTPSLNSKRYSRFEAQVQAVQTDVNTYCEEPEDLDDFNKWKSGFILDEKAEEIENLCGQNGVMEEIYAKLVPNAVDRETFLTRYFYRIYKLKQVDDARANLVKRAISREEEDLSWDVDDDDDDNDEMTDATGTKVNSSEEKELEKKGSSELAPEKEIVEERPVSSSNKTGERSSVGEIDNIGQAGESISDNVSDKMLSEGKPDPSRSGLNGDDSVTKFVEKALLEGKTDAGESSKDSDFSVVSSQPSSPEEEEDLGWDEIEDVGSNDEKKEAASGSPNRADLHKRLSAADEDEDEDLSWDIEDDDEPVKP
ncbi:hypothetical protein NE237_016016 [Protea cynaroides]|uniref:BSD domain-containing protein n=1 Tax=Protea cynaroides TaxID=273540 RepID=A0A9Q0QRM1_9MAGN|nr:hypothetical protein NE237_016016 [Protea cynaroides]